MQYVIFQGEVRILYHAVCLGNTGKTAEGQQKQHDKGSMAAYAADTAGDFQKAVYYGPGIYAGERNGGQECPGNQIQQIKQYHIASQLGYAVKARQNGIVQSIQQRYGRSAFRGGKNSFQPAYRGRTGWKGNMVPVYRMP